MHREGAPCNGAEEYLAELGGVQGKDSRGEPVYLKPKGRGENSMPVKRKMLESVYDIVPQHLSDMVKA